MLYLLWGLLNTGIFLFFISICFRATKLIREKSGLFTSIIFVFGLLSFIIHPNNNNNVDNEPNSNQIKTWKFVSNDSLSLDATFVLDVSLEKTLLSAYSLIINYGKDSREHINVPVSASSSIAGFISGTNWRPISIVVNRTDDNVNFKYRVEGVVEWKLLGTSIYAQRKEYKGIALTK